jgi:uncharacterized protein DUF4157
VTAAVAARVATPAPEQALSSSPLVIRRCACGGTPGVDGECAACRAKRLQRTLLRAPIEVGPPDDEFEREAERASDAVARGTRADGLRPSPLGTRGSGSGLDMVGLGPGKTLPPDERAFMQERLGHNFRGVRIHTGEQAAAAAEAVEARAFTVGSDVVFGAGQYAPGTAAGRRLLAHELTHVAQGHATQPGLLRRTPARKVSCAPGPLNLPDGSSVADPVATITDAENGANATLDAAIDELSFTIDRINAGAEVGWPTISDNLAHAISVMGLDPNDRAVWTGRGIGTAGLLLRRLRLVRGTIGRGSFFFTCLGPPSGTIGACSGPICPGGVNAASCAGSFRINFCAPWWGLGPENQAETLLHESFHNFAAFILDAGREGNAGCYSRFAQIVANVDPAFQRADICPDP